MNFWIRLDEASPTTKLGTTQAHLIWGKVLQQTLSVLPRLPQYSPFCAFELFYCENL